MSDGGDDGEGFGDDDDGEFSLSDRGTFLGSEASIIGSDPSAGPTSTLGPGFSLGGGDGRAQPSARGTLFPGQEGGGEGPAAAKKKIPEVEAGTTPVDTSQADAVAAAERDELRKNRRRRNRATSILTSGRGLANRPPSASALLF